jgi:hypothetical protein
VISIWLAVTIIIIIITIIIFLPANPCKDIEKFPNSSSEVPLPHVRKASV